MQNYLQLLKYVLEQGKPKIDRTQTGTLSVFAEQLRFDLTQGFPLITTKKIHFRSVLIELLWFLRGDTNIQWLKQHGVSIWDKWADSAGELGPIYGSQWRNCKTMEGETIDQFARLMEQMRTDPDSRRHIISAWNVGELSKMRLAPCHVLFQFYIAEEKISCQIYQRSADLFLGVPFNIASYALLTHLVAQQLNLSVGELIWVGGDCHLYMNHLEQAKLQLTRTPLALPHLHLVRKAASLFDYQPEDIQLQDYVSHERINAPVAV